MLQQLRRFFRGPPKCDCPCKEHPIDKPWRHPPIYRPEEFDPYLVANEEEYLMLFDVSLFKPHELTLTRFGRYVVLEGKRIENKYLEKEIITHHKRWFMIPDDADLSTLQCRRYIDCKVAIYLQKYTEKMSSYPDMVYEKPATSIPKDKQVLIKVNIIISKKKKKEMKEKSPMHVRKAVIIPIVYINEYFSNPDDPSCNGCSIYVHSELYRENSWLKIFRGPVRAQEDYKLFPISTPAHKYVVNTEEVW